MLLRTTTHYTATVRYLSLSLSLKFSKFSFTVIFYSKLIGKLTFEKYLAGNADLQPQILHNSYKFSKLSSTVLFYSRLDRKLTFEKYVMQATWTCSPRSSTTPRSTSRRSSVVKRATSPCILSSMAAQALRVR